MTVVSHRTAIWPSRQHVGRDQKEAVFSGSVTAGIVEDTRTTRNLAVGKKGTFQANTSTFLSMLTYVVSC